MLDNYAGRIRLNVCLLRSSITPIHVIFRAGCRRQIECFNLNRKGSTAAAAREKGKARLHDHAAALRQRISQQETGENSNQSEMLHTYINRTVRDD